MMWQDNVIENSPNPRVFMWEILVPTEKRLSKEDRERILTLGDPASKLCFTTRYHRVWDEKVRAITGGLTILTPANGQWVSQDGELFAERMIPERFAASRHQMNEIMTLTMEYYDQLAVMCYKVSDEVVIRHKELQT